MGISGSDDRLSFSKAEYEIIAFGPLLLKKNDGRMNKKMFFSAYDHLEDSAKQTVTGQRLVRQLCLTAYSRSSSAL
jgi:hypothetical protein